MRPIEELAIAQKEVFNNSLFQKLGHKVRTGPFQGMLIPEKQIWGDGNIGTMLIGAYESELHATIEKAILRKPQGICNLGCSWGYYAIGMALRCPNAHVWAIDTDLRSEEMARQYAILNDVEDRISVGQQFCPPYSCVQLAIIDIESSEIEMFNSIEKENVDKRILAKCDFIVETHDFMIEGITDALVEYFTPTHDVEIIKVQPHKSEDYPFLDYLNEAERQFTVIELRPDNLSWVVAWRKGDIMDINSDVAD